MKRIVVILFVLLSAMVSVSGQDVLITADGDIMNVYVDDIGSSSVYYKMENTPEASILRIDKSLVYMIKRTDGTKYDLGNASTPAVQTAVPAPVSAPQLSDEVSKEMMAENKVRVERCNSWHPECTEDKEGDANMIFCSFALSEDSQLINDEVLLSIQWGHVSYDNPKEPTFYKSYGTSEQAIAVTVNNQTDRMIYLDLGNSFFIRGDMATAYYIPTATSTSSTSGSGLGVNAGAVAGALGIGGSVGKLASGINVGGGSSSTTTSVTYSQRVIAVPPKSSKSLGYQHLFEGYSCNGLVVSHLNKHFPIFPEFSFKDDKGKKYDYQIGETHFFNQHNTPLKFSVMVSYSYTEDCASTKSMRVDMYADQILGFKEKTVSKKMLINTHGSLGFMAYTWMSRPFGNQKPANGSFPRP